MHKCYWLKKIIISSLPSYNYHVIIMHTLPPVGTVLTSGSGLEDNILCTILAGETWPWPCSPFIGGEHFIGD